MTGGIKILLATAALATAGCADTGELNIRAVADPLTKAIKPGNPLIAEARGLLALGSVGLAIEAYRKVLRDQPDSIEALAGLAECYDQMGRHDLSRAKYEAALAIAPRNPVLLRTFAASLERQGRMAEGKALRAEADQAETADVAALAQLAPVDAAPVPERVATPVRGIAPAPAPVQERVATPQTMVAVAPAPVAPPPPGHMAPAAIERTAAMPSTGSITVKLPPVPAPQSETRAQAVEAASVTVKLPPATPARTKSAPTPIAATDKPKAASAPNNRGLRLERLSLAEVALVTSSRPRWKTELVRHTVLSTTVRFVPLTPVRQYAGVRLLNAARHQGLAARTRLSLNRHGWNRVTIGDAARVRGTSLVLYSPATELVARRLAAEFGFGIARDPRPGPLTVLLGRDVIGRVQSRS